MIAKSSGTRGTGCAKQTNIGDFTMLNRILLIVVTLVWVPWASASNAPISLIVAHENQQVPELLEQIAAQNGIQLQAHWMDQSELKLKLVRDREWGTAPDIVMVPADHLGLYQQVGYSVVAPSLLNPKLSPKAVDTVRLDGKLYGIPLLLGNHLLLYYNKRWIQQPALNWQDLIDQRTELEAEGINAIRWNYQEMYWLVPFLGARGGWPLDQQGLPSLDQPAMQMALSDYRSLAQQGITDPECDYSCAMEQFTEGHSAYLINGIWAYGDLVKALGDDLGLALLPQFDGHPMVPMYSASVLAFPSYALEGERSEQILAFARLMQSSGVQMQLWQNLKDIPAHTEVHQLIVNSSAPNLSVILEQLNHAKAMPSVTHMTYAWEAMGKGFQRYYNGLMTADQAARYMQQLADRSVSQLTREKGTSIDE